MKFFVYSGNRQLSPQTPRQILIQGGRGMSPGPPVAQHMYAAASTQDLFRRGNHSKKEIALNLVITLYYTHCSDGAGTVYMTGGQPTGPYQLNPFTPG
jgi:hypothetical protein